MTKRKNDSSETTSASGSKSGTPPSTASKRAKREPTKTPARDSSPAVAGRGKRPATPSGTLPLPSRSDGAIVHWPTDLQNVEAVEGDNGLEGQWYFAGPMGPEDTVTAQWLGRLGQMLTKAAEKNPVLAAALGKPKGQGSSPGPPKFPEGYAMFEHRFTKGAAIKPAQVILDSSPPSGNGSKKGQEAAPLDKSMGKNKGAKDGPNKLRVDPYVFGNPCNTKFRSCEEILPHLIWLYTDTTMDHRNCKCIRCKEYIKKLERVLASSERFLVLDQQKNADSNDEIRKDMDGWLPAEPEKDGDHTLVHSLVPQWRAGELVWVKMKVLDADIEDEIEEGTSATVKAAHWRIALDDGTPGTYSDGASSVDGPDLTNPLWPCRVISRFVREDEEHRLTYTYSIYPLHTNADLLGVAESKLLPFLLHMPSSDPAKPMALELTLAATLANATLQALRIAARIRGTETYTWHDTSSTEAATERDKAWIDKMETLNHYKGLWFGADFLRRGDLVRYKPDPKDPERTYLKIGSMYQEIEHFHTPTGTKLADAVKAASYPLDQISQRRTIKVTGEDLFVIPVTLDCGEKQRDVWHLVSRPDSTTEITHADLLHRYRPSFPMLPGMPATEVLHEGADEEGFGLGEAAEERRREAENGWHDADVAATLGIGVKKVKRSDAGSSEVVAAASSSAPSFAAVGSALPSSSMARNEEEDEALENDEEEDFDDLNVQWD